MEGWKDGRNTSHPIFQSSRLPTPVATGTPGFTITELLIVLTLIGILSVISIPTLKGFAATRRLKASAYTLRSLLTFARDMAVTDQTTHLVVFDFDSDRYWLASSETFNPSNPLTSALTAQNSTVVAAVQNNIQRNSGFQTSPTTGTSAPQAPLSLLRQRADVSVCGNLHLRRLRCWALKPLIFNLLNMGVVPLRPTTVSVSLENLR